MPTVIKGREWLTFESLGALDQVPTGTPAWMGLDYTGLRRLIRVGEDRVIPGAPGRLAVDRELDELVTTIPLRIRGNRDWEGNAYADTFLGLDLNHQYLRDNVLDVLDLREVTFHDRHGVEWTGEMFVQMWEPSVDPNSEGDVIIGPLTVVVPAGRLVAGS
jgi:hypothetical protein